MHHIFIYIYVNISFIYLLINSEATLARIEGASHILSHEMLKCD